MTLRPDNAADDLPARLLTVDAELLVRQYRNRNHPGLALTSSQRVAWASEVVVVMEALASELDRRTQKPYNASSEHQAWSEQMKAGKRAVTYKVTPAQHAAYRLAAGFDELPARKEP